jgi:hypothetical protein
VAPVIEEAIEFAERNRLLLYWSEQPQSKYAIGFWIEALYQWALLNPDQALRRRLAEAVILGEQLGLGLPPSVAGQNLEVLKLDLQHSCPSVQDARIRVVNLAAGDRIEFLFCNPTAEQVPLEMQEDLPENGEWYSDDSTISDQRAMRLKGGGWCVFAKAGVDTG